jgi:hypothetical protein
MQVTADRTQADGPLRCDDPGYPALLRQVQSGSCVAFIGSGPSTTDLLYPEWGEAVSRICVHCGLPPMSNEEKEDVNVLLDRADEARVRDEARYCNALKEIFGKPIVNTTRAYDLLIDVRFRSYVTANVDPLLADKSRSSKNRLGGVYTFPALPYDCIEKRSIYYLHGLVDVGVVPRPHQIVLGRQDFAHAYDESNGTLHSFLHQLFSFQTIVFVGCTLREPPIARILESCRKARGQIYGGCDALCFGVQY